MQVIALERCGGPELLTPAEMPQPVPGPEQLLVRVKACALNRADLLQRRGKYAAPAGESEILGLEIAGDVVDKGALVTDVALGAKVTGLVGGGGYAEYCLLDQGMALQIPQNLSYVEAAAIPEAFLTAQEALFTLGELTARDSVLIHAGGSGVGSAAVQLASLVGARVYTTTSDPAKFTRIHALGDTSIINYKQQDVAAEIATLTHGMGVNVIVDFIGASYLPMHLQMLQTAGRLVLVGLMGGRQAAIDLELILHKRLQLKGLIMRSRSLADKRALTQIFKAQWLPAFTTKKLRPVIDSIFPFHAAAQAHAYMETNRHVGKIILRLE